MTKLRVHNFALSLDGYAAGPDQSAKDPLGLRGEELHEWMFAEDRDPAVDKYVDLGIEGIGATIMGRNMFSPTRDARDEDSWTGWWGPNPPFHHPVFVLTHYPRPSVAMDGGTTFHFVDQGIETALALARDAAGGQDIRLAGGAATIRQYLRAGLVDEMHLAVVPVLLGAGERLFEDGITDFDCVESVTVDSVANIRLVKTVKPS